MSPIGEGVQRLTELLEGLVDAAEVPDLIVSDLTMSSQEAVSYTHLTLPTIYSV